MTQDNNLNDEINNRVEDTKPNLIHTPDSEPQQNAQSSHPEPISATNPYAIGPDIANELRSRWSAIQAQFVDQPCTSIEQADALLTDALERIQQRIAHQQAVLRDRWYDHEDVSTEDLRIALQDYRTFLNNLLDQK